MTAGWTVRIYSNFRNQKLRGETGNWKDAWLLKTKREWWSFWKKLIYLTTLPKSVMALYKSSIRPTYQYNLERSENISKNRFWDLLFSDANWIQNNASCVSIILITLIHSPFEKQYATIAFKKLTIKLSKVLCLEYSTLCNLLEFVNDGFGNGPFPKKRSIWPRHQYSFQITFPFGDKSYVVD